MSRRVSNPPQTPLNSDDALERSMRRQRGSTRQRESLADVARRVNDSPIATPDYSGSRRRFSGRLVSGDNGHAPANVPVLPGDFQEWMKMVRLKRVKANNAFTIQLIDCFHNMVQGASFQEATHTLGGCLTVYKNRIASVKDDTSKLLVGVTEKKSAKAAHTANDDDDSEADSESNDDAGGGRRRAGNRRQVPSGADAFLVPGDKLEIDTNELATTIDPLLRKMSADFDKRGAGALLQYSLKPDKNGRLLLDAEAAEDANRRTRLASAAQKSKATSTMRLAPIAEENEDIQGKESQTHYSVSTSRETSTHEDSMTQSPGIEDSSNPRLESNKSWYADLAHFNVAFFANMDLADCEAIPNVNGIAAAVNNPEEGTDALVRSMRAWAMNDPSDTSIYAAGDQDDEERDHRAFGSPSREDNPLGEFEQAPEVGLGFDMGDGMEMDDGGDFDDFGVDNSARSDAETSIASVRPPVDGNWLDLGFLQRVDAQQSNWAGPSFWKIRRLRARDDLSAQNFPGNSRSEPSKTTQPSRKVAKAPAIIDFLQDSDLDAEELFQAGKNAIYLPARQYDESDKHLLPVDMRVTTSQLVNLSLRPNTGVAPAFMREAWSGGDISSANITRPNESLLDSHEDVDGGAGFDDGQNDGFFYGGWDDVDAEPVTGEQRPQTASAMFSQSQPTQQFYGSQRHQLNYARVAKHVDVRKLKDNVWHAISKDTESADNHATTLLDVIHDTQPQYTEQQRADLSPAMYFISLLHLSNEKGMRLENTNELTDIRILANGLS